MSTIQYDLELTDTQECMEEFANYIVNSYKKKLMDYKDGRQWNSMASGKLYNSVSAEVVDEDGRRFEVQISLEDYWKDLEEGQEAGTVVDRQDLLNWIRVKPVIPTERNGYLPNEYQLAYLIQRKIKREGTDPTWYMQYSIDEALDVFEARLTDALATDVTKDIQKVVDSMTD